MRLVIDDKTKAMLDDYTKRGKPTVTRCHKQPPPAKPQDPVKSLEALAKLRVYKTDG